MKTCGASLFTYFVCSSRPSGRRLPKNKYPMNYSALLCTDTHKPFLCSKCQIPQQREQIMITNLHVKLIFSMCSRNADWLLKSRVWLFLHLLNDSDWFYARQQTANGIGESLLLECQKHLLCNELQCTKISASISSKCFAFFLFV